MMLPNPHRSTRASAPGAEKCRGGVNFPTGSPHPRAEEFQGGLFFLENKKPSGRDWVHRIGGGERDAPAGGGVGRQRSPVGQGNEMFVLISTVKTLPVMRLATLKTRFVPASLKPLMTGAGRGMV